MWGYILFIYLLDTRSDRDAYFGSGCECGCGECWLTNNHVVTCDGIFKCMEGWLKWDKSQKVQKVQKVRVGKPQLRVYALFLVIVGRGCALFGVSRLRICDYEDKLPLYLVKSEGFNWFFGKWSERSKYRSLRYLRGCMGLKWWFVKVGVFFMRRR